MSQIFCYESVIGRILIEKPILLKNCLSMKIIGKLFAMFHNVTLKVAMALQSVQLYEIEIIRVQMYTYKSFRYLVSLSTLSLLPPLKKHVYKA